MVNVYSIARGNRLKFLDSQKHISYCFWSIFFLHISCWVILPAIFQLNVPLDVCEGFVWGNEWPLGTYRHPPLYAWLLQAVYYLFGTSPVGFYGLSAFASGFSLYAIYRTGALLISPIHGLMGAALAQNIVYFNFLSTEFNPNVLQMFWTAIGSYVFALALLRSNIIYWILLGCIIALSFYTKYTTLIQATVLFLFLVFNSRARNNFKKTGPYLTVLSFIILFIPHLQWLIQHNFLPQYYIKDRLGDVLTVKDSLYYSLRFLLVQILDCVFSLLGVCLLLYPFHVISPTKTEEIFKRKIVSWLAWSPIVLLILISFISGHKIKDMYGMPFLSFIPLALLSYFEVNKNRIYKFFSFWIVMFLFQITLYVGVNYYHANEKNDNPRRVDFPGLELSKYVHSLWHTKTQTPLKFIIGDTWIAGNIAFYSSEKHRPNVWINGDIHISEWINLSEVKKNGAILIWLQNDGEYAIPSYFAEKFPNAQLGDKFNLVWEKHPEKMSTFGYAYLLPTS